MKREGIQPMQLSAFCRMWSCDAEWTADGAQTIHIWEPLDVDLPETASPSCYLGDRVDFYDHTGNVRLARDVRHHSLGFPNDLVILNGIWWEVGGGRVVYRHGRWFFRFTAWKNSRLAHMMNEGFPAYHDPDLHTRWRYKFKWSMRKLWRHIEPILTGESIGRKKTR